jgi:hypothetical protein
VGQTSLLLFLLHRVIWKNDLSLDINWWCHIWTFS